MKVKFQELKPSQLKAVQGGSLGTVMQSAGAWNRAESEFNLLTNENRTEPIASSPAARLTFRDPTKTAAETTSPSPWRR